MNKKRQESINQIIPLLKNIEAIAYAYSDSNEKICGMDCVDFEDTIYETICLFEDEGELNGQ